MHIYDICLQRVLKLKLPKNYNTKVERFAVQHAGLKNPQPALINRIPNSSYVLYRMQIFIGMTSRCFGQRHA